MKESIGKVLKGESAGMVAKRDHHDWYAELFGPSVTAGIIEASQLAGYRRGPVFIPNSMHTPRPSEANLDSLEALWAMIETEPDARDRTASGHHLLVSLPPY